jgi:hypothetical protein
MSNKPIFESELNQTRKWSYIKPQACIHEQFKQYQKMMSEIIENPINVLCTDIAALNLWSLLQIRLSFMKITGYPETTLSVCLEHLRLWYQSASIHRQYCLHLKITKMGNKC